MQENKWKKQLEEAKKKAKSEGDAWCQGLTWTRLGLGCLGGLPNDCSILEGLLQGCSYFCFLVKRIVK